MRDILLKELLEAGCHFGHQVTRQNPRAREFIFQERDGVHIIDLAKTREGLLTAGKFIHDVAARGGTIMVVGTKRQAKGIVGEALKRMQVTDAGQAGVFFVIERWIGGTLTNFEEVAKNYRKLKDLKARLQSVEEKAKYTKKEIGYWEKDRQKLEKFYGGVSSLEKIPDAIFIVDTHKEDLAVKEANRREVPVVGIVDTNADPTIVDYPIPANDDAVGSLQLIIDYIADAWIEGQKEFNKKTATTETQKENEAQKDKPSDSVVAKEVFGVKKRKSNKKTATTETRKKRKPAQKEVKAKRVSKS